MAHRHTLYRAAARLLAGSTSRLALLVLLVAGCAQDAGLEGEVRAGVATASLVAIPEARPEPCQLASCCPAGQAVLEGGDGDDHVVTHQANTCVVVHGGADHVVHNAHGAATVLGGDGDDFIRGPKGPGLLAGGGGADHVIGGAGDDELHGGAGDDVVMGGAGHDYLSGGDGSDRLFGAAGDDVLYGNDGDDVLEGQDGADFIVPGPGRDEAYGGAGDDTIAVFDPCELEAGEVLDGGPGFDTLIIPITLDEVQALGVVVVGFEHIIVEAMPCLSECRAKNLCEGALVEGTDEDELFCCGAGAEAILPAAGIDRVEAGDGDDTVVIQHVCQVGPGEILDGQGGHDTLITPVPVEELEALGVVVRNFETVLVSALEVNCNASCKCDDPMDICPPEGAADPDMVDAREVCLSALHAFRTFLTTTPHTEGANLATVVASFPGVAAEVADLAGSAAALGPIQEPMPPFTEFDTKLNTCDRPPLPILPGTIDCDQDQTTSINFAFDFADYFNWRAQQIMGAVLDPEPGLEPADIWNAGTESDTTLNNAGFRAWFGTFSPEKAAVVAENLTLDRNVLNGPKNIACWDDPCPTLFQCAGSWLARPLTTARRLTSPCAWTTTWGHAFYALYDSLTLPFPTIEVCDPFFNQSPGERGSMLLHEWLHWKSNSEGSLRDRFQGDGCSGDCQDDDSIRFAREDSPLALRNIRNSQYFQETYGRAYLEDRCVAQGLFCFPPQTPTGTCDDDPPPGFDFPLPSDSCQDDGICVGRPCFETDIHANPADQFSAAHPDGDARFHYCDIDTDTLRELTCIVADRDEVTDNGICVACGEHTRLGCPCHANDDCTDVLGEPFGPLECFGGMEAGWPAGVGFCWPVPVPAHQCEFNCVGLADRFCTASGDCQYVCDHEVGACLSTSADVFTARGCWEDGKMIPDDLGVCQPQCLNDCDCSSAYGYPFDTFVCVANVCEPCFSQSCDNSCE